MAIDNRDPPQPPEDDAPQTTDHGDDTASLNELDEIADNHFPRYFERHYGRLFHSHGTSSPYFFPVDGPEYTRQNALHDIIRRTLNGNYPSRSDVNRELRRIEGQERRVVDLGNGTGQWTIEMANEFPHVKFRGLDIVPLTTRQPPANVVFEMHDINERFRWADGTVDMVYSRGIIMAVTDWTRLVNEVARILRPGGIFISCEWAFSMGFHPDFNVTPEERAARIPGAIRFYNAVSEVVRQRGANPAAAGRVHNLLRSTELYTNIRSGPIYMPIGSWESTPARRQSGVQLMGLSEVYADSVKPMLLEAGYSEQQVRQLREDFVSDVTRGEEGLCCLLHVVYAERV